MFMGVFETFAGLMTLFAVTTGTKNYHYLQIENRTVSPNTLVSTYYVHEESSSGTSVTFSFDDYVDLYTTTSNRSVQAHYFIYNNLPNTDTSSGDLVFYLTKGENNHFNLNFVWSYGDKVNLHLNCWIEWHTAISTYDDFSLDLTRVYVEPWTYSTTVPNFDSDFFDDGGILRITFEVEPVSQEEWYGYYDTGYDEGYDDGYGQGKTDGFTEAADVYAHQDATASTIFTGILNIGLMPINFFLGILNFEVFGINIGGMVAAFMTIAITLIIVRIIFAGGNGDAK